MALFDILGTLTSVPSIGEGTEREFVMGAPKARQVKRYNGRWHVRAADYEEWHEVPLGFLRNSELRRAAMIVFPDVAGNRWMDCSKVETLEAIESGILPAKIRVGTTVVSGPDNSLDLLLAQDEIARLRDDIERLSRLSAVPAVSINLAEPPPAVERRHKSFDQAFKLASLGLHVYLVGPAGTGKSTLAEQVASAMSLPFRAMSCHAQMTGTALFGYSDANGQYVPTDYRRMTTGEFHSDGPGLFLLDEIDNGNPNIIAALNSALANGHVSFPDGLRQIESGHVFMASANTYGTGATLEYLGRNGLDYATLDRFAMLTVDYDESLEIELAERYGQRTFAERIHAYRRQATIDGIRIVLSMRAIIEGSMMLAAGFDLETVLSVRVFRGIDPAQVDKVRRADAHLAHKSHPVTVEPVTVEPVGPVDPDGFVSTTAKYAGHCSGCNGAIYVGQSIYWRKRTPTTTAKVFHLDCYIYHLDCSNGSVAP